MTSEASTNSSSTQDWISELYRGKNENSATHTDIAQVGSWVRIRLKGEDPNQRLSTDDKIYLVIAKWLAEPDECIFVDVEGRKARYIGRNAQIFSMSKGGEDVDLWGGVVQPVRREALEKLFGNEKIRDVYTPAKDHADHFAKLFKDESVAVETKAHVLGYPRPTGPDAIFLDWTAQKDHPHIMKIVPKIVSEIDLNWEDPVES